MGNVPISCCRSKSPRLDSDFRGNNAQYSSSYDSKRLSSKTSRHDGDPSSASPSMHQSTQNILQHISEREPDDAESDPSSNPFNRPIFAQRSSHSRNEQCKLNNSNTQDSYSSTNSSLIRKLALSPLTSSQDHGYNSGASTNLNYQDGGHLTSGSFDGSVQQQQQQQQNKSFGLNFDGSPQQQSPGRADETTQNLLDDSFGPSQAGDCEDQFSKIITSSTNTRPQSSYSRRLYTSRRQGSATDSSLVEDCMKASSCSTIFIDNSTISQPNLDQTIKCVSLAIYYHIRSRSSDEAAEIFDETIHPLRMPTCPQELVKTDNMQQSSPQPLMQDPNHQKAPRIHNVELDNSSRTGEPDQETIYSFVRTLFKAAQLTSEYAITTLVYLERLMTYAEMDLTPRTWRRMFLGAILLSSKVWEDQAIWNVDYAQILEEISVDDINELERQFLELIQFNMNVPSSVYAKYYFHLRTLAIQNGLMGDQTLLTTGQAKELEAMSKVHTTDDWFSSPIHRKSPRAIKKHTSLEKLRSSGNAKAVLM